MKIETKYVFDDKPFEEFLVAVKAFARDSLVVGVVGPEANRIHPTSHGQLQTWQIGALQEFGSRDGHIRPRPFVGNTIKTPGLVLGALGMAARKVVNKQSTPFRALAEAGEKISNAMKETLLAGVPPDNKPATVDWKGHGDTLIGLTGALYDAIGFAIRKGR